MAATKISALTASTALTGLEQIPFGKAGANGRMLASQLPGLRTRTPEIGFVGDSISVRQYANAWTSALNVALAAQPRNLIMRYDADLGFAATLAINGQGTGALWTGLNRTGSLARAAQANDLSVGQANAMKLACPDILWVGTGLSDPGPNAADATFLNYVDTYNALVPYGLKYMICAPMTRGSTGPLRSLLAYLHAWARKTPGVIVLDYDALRLDDSSAGDVSLGGSSGAAGALTEDGEHPSRVLGARLAPYVDAILDAIGVQKIMPRCVDQLDAYNASTLPTGNLLGTKGAMPGSGTRGWAYQTGNFATGWEPSTSAQVTQAVSKSSFTDRRGTTHSR